MEVLGLFLDSSFTLNTSQTTFDNMYVELTQMKGVQKSLIDYLYSTKKLKSLIIFTQNQGSVKIP